MALPYLSLYTRSAVLPAFAVNLKAKLSWAYRVIKVTRVYWVHYK